MNVYCVVCRWCGQAENLGGRCPSCGADALRPGSTLGWKLGEPMVGLSRVPLTRPPEGQLRGPLDEPLDVTRERVGVKRQLLDGGMAPVDAQRESEQRVPVQCGSCGGGDDHCRHCGGRASAPTAELGRQRAAAAKKRPGRRKGAVARVAPRG